MRIPTKLEFNWYTEQKRAYIDDARSTAKKLLQKRPYVTTDDIWKFCPPPRFLNTKVMGNIFHDKDFKSIGFTKTRRLSSHGRLIQKYRLREMGE